MQNPQMLLFGILGSPGCEDMEVQVCKKSIHYGKTGVIWCYNKKIGGASKLGGKGRYVVEVDLDVTSCPRTRSYIAHLFATLTGTETSLRPLDLLKRMNKCKEIRSTPWLAAWNHRQPKGVEVLNRIAGILTASRYKTIVDQFAKEKKKAMSVNLTDHPDDDAEMLNVKRVKRAARRRKEIERHAKVEELTIHLEVSKDIKIGLKEFLLFARESELGRPPTLLDLLASDFTVKKEQEGLGGEEDDQKKDKRICVLRRRLGRASKKKYALLRWKGLPPPQAHNVQVFNARPANLHICRSTDPHPHPGLPILNILILLTDPTHLKHVSYIMRRVAHRMRIKIFIKECLTVERLVTELVQNEQNDDGSGSDGINLCFIQDELPGMSCDQLKRSLELSKVAVPTVFVASPETTPPVYGQKKPATRSTFQPSNSSVSSLTSSMHSFSSSMNLSVHSSTHSSMNSSMNSSVGSIESLEAMNALNGYNHQLEALIKVLVKDPLSSYPGHHGAGCENIVGVPWTIICLPFTRINVLDIFQSFWLPLQHLTHRPWSHASTAAATRPPPPSCKEFLGKSAADTLQFQHRSGLGRNGICTWYASQQHSIVRNVPSIEKQWMIDADQSLIPGGKKLNFGRKSSRKNNTRGQTHPKKKQNVLFNQKVKVQKRQIKRRMQEHIRAQSKIVLDLLPGR